jgi:hypothetical protein
MDATGKLRDLARRFTTHQRECNSALGVAMTPLDVDDDSSIELICSRCATSFIETFTRDDTRQLRDAGIVTGDDVRQFVATAAATPS